MKKLTSLLIAALMSGAFLTDARAQGGAAIRVAEEVAESLLRRGGAEAMERSAKELAEFGGARAVREVLEAAEKEGGEVLMRQVAAQAQKHGVLALSALRGAPATVIRAVDGLPAELAENGLRALAHQPQVVAKIVTESGEAALHAVAKLPAGVGTRIGSTLGKEGMEVAGKLTADQATLLGRYADDLAKLPADSRKAWFSWMKDAPEKVFAWMGKHPRATVVAVVTGTVIAARKEIFGTDGNRGMLERMMGSLYETFEKPINLVVAALAGIVLVWSFFRVMAIRRAFRRA